MSFDSDLKELLRKHEGWKKFPYTDTVGKLSIGCGRNLTDRGLDDNEIMFLLEKDIIIAMTDLQSIFPDFFEFSDRRRVALISLAFIGKEKLLGFKKMIQAVKDGRWDNAGDEVIESKYAKQVGERALEIAEMLREG